MAKDGEEKTGSTILYFQMILPTTKSLSRVDTSAQFSAIEPMKIALPLSRRAGDDQISAAKSGFYLRNLSGLRA